MNEIGTGIVGWSAHERRTNRYGRIYLRESLDAQSAIELAKDTRGAHGRLIAAVKETRQSHHIGDLFQKVFPQTPEVGERIVLGEGVLVFGPGNTVGILPDDGRDELLMDIKALYRAHDQTVTLFFEQTSLN